MGKYARAEPLYRQALGDQEESALGEEHPSYADWPQQPGLNCTYRWASTLVPSRSYRQALEIRKKSAGRRASRLCQTASRTWVWTVQIKGPVRPCRAAPPARPCRDLQESAVGEEHPFLCHQNLNNLGRVAIRPGQLPSCGRSATTKVPNSNTITRRWSSRRPLRRRP